MFLQIAIDGPSGSGKSTTAKALSKELNYLYVNTGLIFRGLAWYLVNHPEESIEEALTNITKYKNFVFRQNSWFLDNEEIVEKELINEVIAKKASEISTIKIIRDYVLVIEKDLASKDNVIMDGRDIGTSIFPNAILKIFLVASLKKRAERRYQQLLKKDALKGKTIEDIEKELMDRDKKDVERELSPLIKAEDAIEIIGDNMTIEEIVNTIKDLLKTKLQQNS